MRRASLYKDFVGKTSEIMLQICEIHILVEQFLLVKKATIDKFCQKTQTIKVNIEYL